MLAEKNPEAVATIKKERAMKPKWMEIFKDEIDEQIRAGEMRVKVTEAVKIYREEMHLGAEEVTNKLMDRFTLSRESAESYVKETLNLQKV